MAAISVCSVVSKAPPPPPLSLEKDNEVEQRRMCKGEENGGLEHPECREDHILHWSLVIFGQLCREDVEMKLPFLTLSGLDPYQLS